MRECSYAVIIHFQRAPIKYHQFASGVAMATLGDVITSLMTLYVVNVCAASLEDVAQCLSKGFTSSLTCSSCDLLPRFDLVSLQVRGA